jgi:hypothetical protein
VRLHERVAVTQPAEVDLSSRIIDWLDLHDLTYAEAIRILAYELAKLTKYPVRQERHPDDPEKKADEA